MLSLFSDMISSDVLCNTTMIPGEVDFTLLFLHLFFFYLLDTEWILYNVLRNMLRTIYVYRYHRNNILLFYGARIVCDIVIVCRLLVWTLLTNFHELCSQMYRVNFITIGLKWCIVPIFKFEDTAKSRLAKFIVFNFKNKRKRHICFI